MVVIALALGSIWFFSRSQPASIQSSSQQGSLPPQISGPINKIVSSNPFASDKQKVEAKLSNFRTDPKNIPQPELFSESDLDGWKEDDPERERYQLIGTVDGFENGILKLSSNVQQEVPTDAQTVFACVEQVNSNSQLKNYTQTWTDYQRYIPFEIDTHYLQTQLNLSTYTPDEVSAKILKNSWAYVWIPSEKWDTNTKTASLVILTYCLF